MASVTDFGSDMRIPLSSLDDKLVGRLQIEEANTYSQGIDHQHIEYRAESILRPYMNNH